MAQVARASKTVRNKNLIILAMCLVFMGMFVYDGWVGYPARNDRLVKTLDESSLAETDDQPLLKGWKGWAGESDENREKMDALAIKYKGNVNFGDWKTARDVSIQRWICYFLVLATGAAIRWFVKCQRRRVIAEEGTVSPAPGVVIPWEKITKVDNTRWKSMGIVEITYSDASGASQKAKFDDYEVEREPLLGILDTLGEKAVNAEFIPKEETPAPEEKPPAAA